MAQLSPYQRDILIRTALGEARGEGVEGMADVIQTIFNRAGDPRFPSDPAVVALQPGEYSTWNKGAGGNNPQQFSQNSEIYQSAAQALDMVLNGRPDYTGGAIFYKTPEAESRFHDKQNKFGVIERHGHVYYPTHPMPAGEIPNVVASLTDTRMPSRPPIPETISPDLAQMRDPRMSPTARAAQVTPEVPLPRPRPSAPDIVTPTMASLRAPMPPANTARAADIELTSTNAVTPRLTEDGSDIYSYHIPDITPTDLVGGRGSLTPSIGRPPMPAQQSPQLASIRARDQDLQTALNSRFPTRLPKLTSSSIGQPPTTRTVQSVPMQMAPTAREIAQAPGVTVATVPTVTPAGSAARNIQQQRMEQASIRRPPIPDRLPVGVAEQNYDIAINGPPGLTRQQYAQLDQPSVTRIAAPAPMPMPADARPTAVATRLDVQPVASRIAPVPMPAGARPVMTQRAPLRVVVQRDPPARQPAPRLSAAERYAQANARNHQPSLEDRVRGSSGLSSYGASAYSISG